MPVNLNRIRRVSVGPAVAAALGLVLTGCGGGAADHAVPNAPPGQPGGPQVTPPGVAGSSAQLPTSGARSPVRPVSAAIPRDAKYTIVCVAFNGPGHEQRASVSKDNLIHATRRADFYVVHDEAQSTLYYGYYRERERSVDPVEAARTNADLEWLRGLTNPEGQRLFTKSLVVPLPTPDPAAPPEFDLTRIDSDKAPDDPTRRYWSIAIADYTGDVQIDGKGRKQLAVEAVMDARRMGYEAYYYNGPNTSTVCIGAWPRRAVREQEANEARTNADNGQDLVISTAPLPKAVTDNLEKSGRDIKIMQPKLEIDDRSLVETWAQFKDYSINGNIEISRITDPRTGQITRKPKETFLVEIPRAQPASLLANDRTNSVDQSVAGSPGLANPLTPGGGTSASGQLRSVAR